MLTSIQNMLNKLDENKIMYCHWKSNEHLEAALNGNTDLDILFLPEQRRKIDVILNECGLKRFRSVELMQYQSIEDYIGFDQETACIWHLHLHYRMTLGEKHLKGYTITPWTNYIINNRICTEEGVYTALPECELVLLFVRMALKLRWRDACKKISRDDTVEMNWLKSRIDMQKLSRISEEMLNIELSHQIMELVDLSIKKRNQLIGLQTRLRKHLKYFTGYSKMESWWNRSKRELFWIKGSATRRLGINTLKPCRRISPSGGVSIVFIGCDGAGKSTTLSYVKKELNKKLDVVTLYMGSGEGNSSLIRKPMKLIANKIGGRGLGHEVEKEYQERLGKKVSLKARLYSLAKVVWGVSLAQEKKHKLNQMTYARNSGMIVLADRYPQAEIMGYGDGPLLSRYLKSKGLLSRIANWECCIYASASINKPDLVIKLTVPTQLAIERKPEMTVEEIENKKTIVRQLHIGNYEVEIDTSESIEKTRSKVMAAIWNVL